jgi:hypothetical protein
LSERQGQVHGSLRSIARGINVAQIAESFGGGGHEVAAAFRIDGSLKQVEDEVLAKARSFQLKQMDKAEPASVPEPVEKETPKIVEKEVPESVVEMPSPVFDEPVSKPDLIKEEGIKTTEPVASAVEPAGGEKIEGDKPESKSDDNGKTKLADIVAAVPDEAKDKLNSASEPERPKTKW